MAIKLDMDDKVALAVAAGAILLWLAFVGTIGFIAIHFITKFW
jgi:hypothetical protein